MEIVSEKAFFHSQISMISLQNFSVTFRFVSNLLRNLRAEMILYLKNGLLLKKCISPSEVDFNKYLSSIFAIVFT